MQAATLELYYRLFNLVWYGVVLYSGHLLLFIKFAYTYEYETKYTTAQATPSHFP